MAVQKAKSPQACMTLQTQTEKRIKGAVLLVCAIICICVLSSCGAVPLTNRCIVRAIFFEEKNGVYTAVLLVNAQSSANSATEAEPNDKYEALTGKGKTPAFALAQAETAARGQIFYGTADLLCLPQNCSWESAKEICNSIKEEAEPLAELELRLLQQNAYEKKPLSKAAPEIYDEWKVRYSEQPLRCGWERLDAQTNQVALPVETGDERYAFAILRRGKAKIDVAPGVPAQLCAVFCGMTQKMQFAFAKNRAICSAIVRVDYRPEKNCSIVATLSLSSVQMRWLASRQEQMPQADELEALVRITLNETWQKLQTDLLLGKGNDPLQLSFWQQMFWGSCQPRSIPKLRVNFVEQAETHG